MAAKKKYLLALNLGLLGVSVLLSLTDKSIGKENFLEKSVIDKHYNFSVGDLWQLPDLKASELYYDIAKRHFDEDGRSIVNASSNSELNIFERIPLEEFLYQN